MTDLFGEPGELSAPEAPLAERLRPQTLADVVGQDHLLGSDAPLTRMVASGKLGSLILWGPPGSGKTTIARLLADAVNMDHTAISAIFSGVADLKKVFEAARMRAGRGRRTLLFVDEIHRFNRAQQDSFLPVMEDGTIVLVGATTENPSFELNAALLSRAQVLTLKRLEPAALSVLLERAERQRSRPLPATDEARKALIALADGDGRALIALAEALWNATAEGETVDHAQLLDRVQRRAPIYDKGQEGHYNLISALHKAVRGSDPQAALYYLHRMFDAGEDRLFLARRIVRMASEDIGLADPQALGVTIAAMEAYRFLGSPEGELALEQAVVHLATAPKSNALYVASKAAAKTARQHGSLMPPKHILNAPTTLMREEGYGDGYLYDHDAPGAFSGQAFLPDEISDAIFYEPTPRGFEARIGERLAHWRERRKAR